MAIFILGLVVALLNAAAAGLFGVSEVYGKTFFLLMVAVGLGCLGIGMVMPRRRKTKTLPAGKDVQRALHTPAATSQLPPLHEEPFPVPSITEQTTRNLR
jgi:hypothetical protein